MNKKLILIAIAALFTVNVWAQTPWQTGSDGKIYYNNGNVGIGTTIPQAKLHLGEINGAGIILSTNSAGSIADPLSRKIQWSNYLGNEAGSIDLLDMSYNTHGTSMVFSIKNEANTLQEALRINWSGSIGIGTSNPQAKLHVSGTFLTDDPNFSSDWNSIWQSGFFEGSDMPNAPEAGHWFWGLNLGHSSNNENYRYGGQLLIKNYAAIPTMYFRSRNVDGEGVWAKVVSSQGDHEINGTLQINGDFSGNKMLLNDPNTPSNWNSIWQSGFFEGYNIPNAPEQGQWFWGINMGHSSNSESYTYGGQLLIKNNSAESTMYFRSKNASGEGVWAKVINSQGDQLINGSLTVDGTIRTEEVKVEIIGGADFVFEEDYQLLGLDKLEEFVKKEKRLPEIAAEKEMLENGVDVSKFQIQLLQKIEELTLYVIDLKKENESLKEKVDVLMAK